MEYIIDKIIQNNQANSKYRTWALQLFLFSILSNAILISFSLYYITEIIFEEVLYFHALIGLVTFIVGLGITYLGLKVKEDKSYQYAVSTWGLFVLILSSFAIII